MNAHAPPNGSHLTVLGLIGSLRAGSYNRMLLHTAREIAGEHFTVAIHEIGSIPMYNADVEAEGDPEPVTRLKEAILAADGLLISTPEYDYSVPGVLKNTLEWASRPPGKHVLRAKPVAIMGASTGMVGTARAQLQLRQILVYTASHVLHGPEILVARAKDKFDADGRLTDETARKLLARMLGDFADWIRFIRNRDAER